MPRPEYRCGRCDQWKPLSEFPPSKVSNRGQWCRLCHREKACGPEVDRACDGPDCSVVLRVTTRRAAEPRVFCSRPCKYRHKNARLRAEPLERKLAAPARFCPHCGEELDPAKRADACFCSQTCEEAAHNATRKAKWKVGYPVQYVSRAQIIARDGLVCHICGLAVEPDDVHLDHVIPLARGGTHAADNLAVAHSRCNLSKRHSVPA